ncbi:reverse transcriptase domain-containing protein [Tanacetum coccineum]
MIRTGVGRNQNGDAVNDHIRGDARNATEGNDRRGCTYKEFLACNPKEYDGKGGAIVYTRWIEKMESVHDMSRCKDSQRVKYSTGSFVGKALMWWNSKIRTRGREAAIGMSWEDYKTLTREEFCPSNEMQKLETKLWNHTMVGAGHAAYTDMFHKLARLVPNLVTPEVKKIERYVYGLAPQIQGMVAATKPKTIQKAMRLAGTLTDEALRNGSIKKNLEKRGNMGEASKDMNGREDNKRTRTGNAFATTVNPVRRGYTGTTPNCTTCGYYHLPKIPCLSCFNYNRPGHFARDCRVVPRNVNPVNTRNPIARTCCECGSTDHIKSACPRAFMLGAEEARQDPNIMMGLFTLNNHYATTLFDSGADYSFVSTTFIPLLDIDPSDLGFSYEIEIASGQLVEIDKVIRRCKIEIEGHMFNINLIPFGSGSFDVIIGMDWLSDHKAEIICHEKVVRIPLLDGKDNSRNSMTRVSFDQAHRLGKHRGIDEIIELRSDGALNYLDRIWVPLKGDVRTLIMDEAHKSKYYVYTRADKMYYDLRDRYWWPGMKKDIVVYVSKCLTCLKVKAEHQTPSGLLQQHEILEWKWEGIAMDFISKLPRTSSGHDTIWVIVDRLTKSAHFLPMREDYKMDRLASVALERCGTLWEEGKLAPRFVGPFEIIEKLTQHCKYLLDEIRVDDKLNFVEEPVEIMEREFKKLKRSRIAIVKVWWNLKRRPEFTWEREDQMKLKYPHLFSDDSS